MSFPSVNSGSLDDILLVSSDFTTWGGLLARDKKHPKVRLLRRWPSVSFGVETVDNFFPWTSARSLIKMKIWIFYNNLLNREPKHIKTWTNHSLNQKKAWSSSLFMYRNNDPSMSSITRQCLKSVYIFWMHKLFFNCKEKHF